MAPPAAKLPPTSGGLTWRPTKIMNMHDLSKDDDFLSHLLVEKLGTGTVPLHVHKMDSSRRLPKTDAHDLLQIVRRLVIAKGPVQHVIRQAVDELLKLPSIRYYVKAYTQKQINAFATHASRYFELYHPSGSIEIAHTSRYSHRTGKSELCILATRFLVPGTVITELKGSMANLTDEEDKELKRTDLRNCDIRRDFSVIHSKQMKKNHLFLGPARFVNHDCDNNCELFREGKYITFRVLRPISIGEEITAHYGDGYFGRRNRHCLCETCEKNGRGGYAPDHTDDDLDPSSDTGSSSDSDSESDAIGTDSDTERQGGQPALNMNERRTRRGVYAILPEEEDGSGESDNEEDDIVPLADAKDIPADGEIELTAEVDAASELTSLSPSRAPSDSIQQDQSPRGMPTPTPDPKPPSRSLLSSKSLSSAGGSSSTTKPSIISTRRQKAKDAEASSSKIDQQLVTPPLSEDTASIAESSGTPTKRVTRSVSSLNSTHKGKGKERETPRSTPGATTRTGVGKDEVKVKKEEPEPRVLRARPFPVAPEAAKEFPPVREIPKGPDGKPLPTCFTCENILPVISVDSKVVWGLGAENSPKKKKGKQYCPRCIRHFAIYAQPWPSRLPPHGTAFLPTPREETTPVDTSKRVTPKALPVLDRKLAAAASESAKSRKRDLEKEERPTKRRKTEPGPPGMTSRPKKAFLMDSRQSLSREPEVVKRKRGRPRLSSPKRTIKAEEPPIQVQVESTKTQPRNTNGRFERKDDPVKPPVKKADVPVKPVLSRAERAIERGKIKSRLEQQSRGEEDDSNIPARNRKRGNDDDDERSGKRSHVDTYPFHKVLPRPASNFRGGISNPNPLSFAVRAWAYPMLLDESSSEDEKGPVTPEDDLSPPAAIVDLDIGGSRTNPQLSLLTGNPVLPRVAPTFKPSPFTFARRRWASVSVSPGREDDPEAQGQGSSFKGKGRAVERPEGPSDIDSLARGVRYSSISSLSSAHARPPSYSQWPAMSTGQLYDDEDDTNISDVSVDRMTPLSDGYPSALSSDDEQFPYLRHVYPTLPTDPNTLHVHASTSFPLDQPSTPPHFIHAGWDSCSEVSDL